jgi:hypothetical protein
MSPGVKEVVWEEGQGKEELAVGILLRLGRDFVINSFEIDQSKKPTTTAKVRMCGKEKTSLDPVLIQERWTHLFVILKVLLCRFVVTFAECTVCTHAFTYIGNFFLYVDL